MPTTIELPHVGESVTEGIIGKWLVRPGEWVEKYAPLVEVMTDKVNMEVPSPFSGTLTRVLADEGETVPMGAPIAEMEVEGAAPEPGSVRPEALEERAREEGASGRTGEGRAFEFVESVRSVGPTGSGEGGQGRPEASLGQPQPATSRASHPSTSSARAGKEGSARRAGSSPPLSPLVRRLVAQHGVDAAQLQGTGRGGRITKEDVIDHVESRQTLAQRAEAGRDEEEVPLTPLRRSIAEHVARSAREIPAAWTMLEVDVTGLVACRERHRDEYRRKASVPLTHLPFVVAAVAEALKEHPRLNSRWDGGRLYTSRRVHIGIAVATAEGLVVPVVQNADALGVGAIAARVHELAERARRQALRLEDVQGGTFTVNNTGALGSVVSYPIINHPQAAILTTEAIVKRPVVTADGAVAVRSMMNVGLAFDHRACDGADASAFLGAVKSRLEAITEETPLS